MRREPWLAAVLLVAAACDGAGGTLAAGPTGGPAAASTFAIASVDGVPVGSGAGAEACDGPLSSRYTLAAGRWSSESHWYADCLDSTRPRAVVVQSASGSLTTEGTEVVLHPDGLSGTPVEEEERVHDTLTLWGHCGGETRYARLRTASP